MQNQLDIQPTLTIGPGRAVCFVVERDLVLKPYEAGGRVTKLKLGAFLDDKPVKLTVDLPADIAPMPRYSPARAGRRSSPRI